MQRNVNESFEDYKVRRAASNLAVKMINADSRGGKANVRANRGGKGYKPASYAENLRMHFARKALELLTIKKGA